MIATKLLEKLDKGTVQQTPRMHLGGSEIGKPCTRRAWYSFRWVTYPSFEKRMLRLFDRGHREELVFEHLLKEAGCEIYTVDNDTGEQFRISDYHGHFGGSLDGIIFGVPDMPNVWMLLEMKTHNDKSFKQLKAKGVRESKPEHLAQMQIYMHYKKLTNALYCATNKNDDELHFEIVGYEPDTIPKLQRKAETALFAEAPPTKLSENPAFWQCKFCQFHGVCHMGEPPELNCRTCNHVEMLDDGKWKCSKHGDERNKKQLLEGCKDHERCQSIY